MSVGVRLRKTNSIEATSESLCCPAKCIVSFKRGLLIKNQQRRITAGSGAVTQRLLKPPPTPSFPLPHSLESYPETTAAFQDGPSLSPPPPLPSRPPVRSSTGVWRSASDCVISPLCLWLEWPGLLLLASHFSSRMPPPLSSPLPVPGRSPSSVRLCVCQTEELATLPVPPP